MGDGIKIGIPSAAQGALIGGYGSRALERGAENKNVDIEKVAQDFESYFIFTIMKELGKTINGTKKSYSEQTYMSIMYEKIGDCLSKKGLGVKDILVKYAGDKNVKVFEKKGDNVIK